jgi:hypothetical protein
MLSLRLLEDVRQRTQRAADCCEVHTTGPWSESQHVVHCRIYCLHVSMSALTQLRMQFECSRRRRHTEVGQAFEILC